LSIVEDNGSQTAAIHPPLLVENRRAEPLQEKIVTFGAGLVDFVRDPVGVDDEGPAIGEHRRYGGLAGPDAAGEPYQAHGCILEMAAISAMRRLAGCPTLGHPACMQERLSGHPRDSSLTGGVSAGIMLRKECPRPERYATARVFSSERTRPRRPSEDLWRTP
jgi:hypothetical protein